MARNTDNYAALSTSLLGQVMNITVNTRPQPIVRTGMSIISIKGTCLTASDKDGNQFNYTFGAHNMDEQEDGSIHLYDVDASKPSVMVVLRKAG